MEVECRLVLDDVVKIETVQCGLGDGFISRLALANQLNPSGWDPQRFSQPRSQFGIVCLLAAFGIKSSWADDYLHIC